MMLVRRLLLACFSVLFALAAGACDPPSGQPSPSSTASQTAAPAAPAPLIEWVAAPDGDVVEIVLRERERAKRDGRTLLVYVGAVWCEPCKRFHEAADRGEIAGELPPLRMLELDLDRDADRLAAAGYGSKMIPLFAVPGPDGRGTDLRLEGSIKGAGAVSNIVPRLRALLARAKGS
jgi:hypothetical protein